MGGMDLVRKYQCDECGMFSDRSAVTETMTIRRDCPVCKEATTHYAVEVDQAQADTMANIERQLKEQA
jgi:hypothetical protein